MKSTDSNLKKLVSYQKKDGRGHVLKVCFLVTRIILHWKNECIKSSCPNDILPSNFSHCSLKITWFPTLPLTFQTHLWASMSCHIWRSFTHRMPLECHTIAILLYRYPAGNAVGWRLYSSAQHALSVYHHGITMAPAESWSSTYIPNVKEK